MTTTRRTDTWLSDMGGVLVREDEPIPDLVLLLVRRDATKGVE